MARWASISGERLGLTLIGAALIAIFSVTTLVLRSEQSQRRDAAQAAGTDLVRSVSHIALSEIFPNAGPSTLFPLAQRSIAHPDFLYLVVADLEGRPLFTGIGPSVPLRVDALPEEPASWFGENRSRHPAGAWIREFRAPIFEGDRRAGQVRVAFREPSIGALASRGPFLALLSLPIFLLVPLFYLLFRKEIAPIARIAESLNQAGSPSPAATLPSDVPSGWAQDIVESVRSFVASQEELSAELRESHTALLSSSSVYFFERNRLKAIVDAFPQGAFVLDGEAKLVLANRRLETIIGCSATELSEARPLEWLPNEDARLFIGAALEGRGRDLPAREIDLHCPGVTEQRFELSSRSLDPDEDQENSFGTLFLLRDIGDEHAATRAQHEFLAHVSHELKTPISVFSMYSELLLGKDGEQEPFRIEACNAIQDQVERLTSLVDALLAIARIESGNLELNRTRVRVDEFLHDLVATMSKRIDARSLEISSEVPDGVPAMQVDKEMIRVAVSNLMTNAIKYSDSDGKVVLRAEMRENSLEISVSDNGVGLSEEDQRHVFEKFFRSDAVQTRPGHGLGLALAHQIVNVHGGQIRVESRLTEGSVFTITLPHTALLQDR